MYTGGQFPRRRVNVLQENEGEICANRRVTIGELRHIFCEVSKTTIHEAVTDELGYRKLCARWVPKMLTDDHKTKRMGSALKFLTRYAQEGDEFMESIANGDETWGFHHTTESKQQSLQWRHTHSHITKKIKNFNFSEKNHGGTLDRRCHYKHVSLKQSRFYHCQMSMAHRYRIKVDGSVAIISIKKFPYRPTCDVTLLFGHAS